MPRWVLGWLALVVCCGALLGYAYSRPAAVTTGVAVQGESPWQPHESGTPAPAPEETARDWAAETVLEREQSRSQRLEWLKAIAEDPETSAVTRDDAQRRLLDELDRAGKEQELAGLLAAKGFAGAVVVLNDRGLTISVRGKLADPAAVARLGELASRMTGLPPERIVIMDGR